MLSFQISAFLRFFYSNIRFAIIITMSLIDGLKISKELFKDQDVESVKMMVGKLVTSDDVEVFRVREQQHLGQIDHLHRVIADLDARLKGLDQQYRKVVGALNQEREARKQDKISYDIEIKKLMHEKASPIYFSPKTEADRMNAVKIENYTPERSRTPSRYENSGSGKGSYLRRLETPIGQLYDIRHTEPSKDQIHRLNSYLIENTTSLKLLIEKHNYLLKLRGLGEVSRDQELELIAKSKRIINDRKAVEQAKRYLDNSRKKNYLEDGSESQIENQVNNIVVSTL